MQISGGLITRHAYYMRSRIARNANRKPIYLAGDKKKPSFVDHNANPPRRRAGNTRGTNLERIIAESSHRELFRNSSALFLFLSISSLSRSPFLFGMFTGKVYVEDSPHEFLCIFISHGKQQREEQRGFRKTRIFSLGGSLLSD